MPVAVNGLVIAGVGGRFAATVTEPKSNMKFLEVMGAPCDLKLILVIENCAVPAASIPRLNVAVVVTGMVLTENGPK